MTFAQLLQNLGSYLDFSKRMATTVPGLVMALALVLVTGSAPTWVTRPFGCGDTLKSQQRAAAADSRLQSFDGTWGNGLDMESRFFLRSKERALFRQYSAALAQVSACKTNCVSQVKAASASLEALKEFESSTEGQLWRQYENAIRASTSSEARAARTDAQILAAADWELARNEGAGRCASTGVTWTEIVNQVLMFGLVGFAFGVLLDPINKAIFLQVFPDAIAGVADVARRQTNRVARALIGFAVVPLRFVVPEPAVERSRRRTSSSWSSAHPLSAHTAQFYIGHGVITDGEYQGLVDSYYRFAELTIGLALPLVIIGAGVFAHEHAMGNDLNGVFWAVLIFAAAGLAARVGIRRHVEFTRAVSDLIQGRLEKIDEQARVDRQTVDLTQLHLLVDRATLILGAWSRP